MGIKRIVICDICGTVFSTTRADKIRCSRRCSQIAANRAKRKRMKTNTASCPHNEHLICEVHSCSRCGWNPVVAKQRLAAIIAKMKEGTNGQA